MDWGWVDTYQTLIAGGLGFAGVIGTLFVNAYLGRRERRDERDHERATRAREREHERQTLRATLIEELEYNYLLTKRRLEALKYDPKYRNEGVTWWAIPLDDAYSSLLPKLGVLSQWEVRKVMIAYLTLRGIARNFFSTDESTYSAGFGSVHPDRVDALMDQYGFVLHYIKEAVSALGGDLKDVDKRS